MNLITNSTQTTMVGIIDEIILANLGIINDIDMQAEVSQNIEKGFIYGPYGSNDHYNRSEIMDLVRERILVYVEGLDAPPAEE